MTLRAAWGRFFRASQSWPVFLLVFGSFVVEAALSAWPASDWMEVRSVRVFDARAGEPIRLFVDRAIKSDFVASFSVRVRLERGGTSEVVCSVDSQPGPYRADARLPDPLTLDWWTHGRCASLPPGVYTVTTTWRIDPPPDFIPAKTVTVRSNPFEVKP